MELQTFKKIKLTGLSVTTTNADECQPETAKIGQLWEFFYKEIFPKLSSENRIYGVYTNYESDYNGKYDVIACSDFLNGETQETFVQTNIETGQYLVFSAQGELPDAVISLWQEVWHYFAAEDCQHKRSYTTDFEFYKGAQEVEIYIAVESLT
ncbi:GyrI-like domain-containing protein [Vibrio tubiashii]|uniref:GyrI-like domain-containing protein n=1 Tax=Vibrio tubiashii TaxID=29498 RepID=UPI001EFCDA75|nr:effector binding domain-containing protein [Vibrio tubiashii]MCG9577395.1 GyrI-like domain-containing protein [Vibrio tubiashii]